MDKKTLFLRIVSKFHCIYRLILLSLFCAVIVFAESRKAVTDIETYFSDLDSALSFLGQEVTKKDAAQAKEPLEKMLNDYPGIEFLLWTNSKGVVANEADRDGKPGKPHRNLSRQKWFKTTTNLEPYYGSLRTRKGDHQLFWCKPIRITKSGKDSFGGAIVVRIDLKRSFDAVAKKTGRPFRILLKEEPLFSHSWEMTYDSTAVPLAIKGIADLQINAKQDKPVVKATPPPEPVKEKEAVSFLTTKTLIVLVPIAVVLILLLIIIKVVIRKRQEALIREIEGDEPFEPDKPFDKVKEFDEKKEDKLLKDVKAAETALPKKKEEDSPKETALKKPPDKKKKSIFDPEESTSEEESTVEEESKEEEAEELAKPEESTTKETAEFAEPEELPDAEEKKAVETEMTSSVEETDIMDLVPEETQILRPELAEAIKAIEPGEEDETEAAAEEAEEAIPSKIMEKVQALLKKHVHSVLEERAKQIEEDVLDRVRDELAGGMKDKKE